MNEVTDELTEKTIKEGLVTRTIGRNVICHETLPSTMDAAREAGRNGAPDGTVVVTGQQTRGRGRLQRPWQTPAGNIALSVILYPDKADLPYLIMMASLAAALSIEEVTGLKADIKWPNDILVNGLKVCGILVENEVRSDLPPTAIVGIGINTALDPASLGEVLTPATSLRMETGEAVSRAAIVRKLLEAFDRMWGPDVDRLAVYAAWKERLVTLGKPVTVTWKDSVMEGVAEDVDESGALAVRDEDGNLTTVVAGDVSLRTVELPAEEAPEETAGEAAAAEEAGETESPDLPAETED